MAQSLPFLDITAPGFSTRGPEVVAARAVHWCARTPLGLAVLRHREAGQLLRDRRLRQGSHAWPDVVGIAGPFADFWRRSLIGLEGEAHRRLRALTVPALAPAFIGRLEPRFEAIAEELAEGLTARGRAEFMADFAVPFAGRAICALLAIDERRWPGIGGDASALGLAMGLDARSHQAAFNAACARLLDTAEGLIARARRGADPGGLVGRLWAQAGARGDVTAAELRDLVVISIFGGVDTTRAQLGFLLALFIEHPEQWQHLRRDPKLAANAVEEAIRHRPTTTWATREALEDFDFAGIPIEAGQTLHILVHATATDPAVFAGGGFDITARRRIHFGFGGGAHNCLGQGVARADIACALRALAARVARFTPDGAPEWLPDSGNTAPARLPVRIVPA